MCTTFALRTNSVAQILHGARRDSYKLIQRQTASWVGTSMIAVLWFCWQAVFYTSVIRARWQQAVVAARRVGAAKCCPLTNQFRRPLSAASAIFTTDASICSTDHITFWSLVIFAHYSHHLFSAPPAASGASFAVGRGQFGQGLKDAIFPNPLWTFYAATQHCVVFILVKETLQMTHIAWTCNPSNTRITVAYIVYYRENRYVSSNVLFARSVFGVNGRNIWRAWVPS